MSDCFGAPKLDKSGRVTFDRFNGGCKILRTRSVCLTTSFEGSSGRSTPTRVAIDSDLRDPLKPKKSSRPPAPASAADPVKIQDRKEAVRFSCPAPAWANRRRPRKRRTLFWLRGLCRRRAAAASGVGGRVAVAEEGGMTGRAGALGVGSIDSYYEMMIEANPGNPLFLANYAKFLKEIHRDGARAEAYFDQAVKTDPNDCYALASYARFLWDADDDEEEDEEDAVAKTVNNQYAVGSNKSPSDFIHKESHWPPLAAAS